MFERTGLLAELPDADRATDGQAPGKRTLTAGLVAQRRAGMDDGAGPSALLHPLAGDGARARESSPLGSASFLDEIMASSGGGQPLSSSVLARMEHSFDTSFAGVRVHEGSAAAQAGAQAFTAGEDIHFAPGQYDPDSARGQELIGHELAHVVQQREGRVDATGQAKGLPLNDDGGLEREADEQGARAAAGEKARPGSAPAGGSRLAAVQRRVMQRRVGFEFETTDGWWFEGRTAAGAWENITHTKNQLVKTPNGQGGISSDNGHVEFVTDPVGTLADVQNTVGELIGLKDRFIGATSQLVDGERGIALAQEGNQHNEVRVRAAPGAVVTRPQATGGFRLDDIPRLFATLERLHAPANNAATRAEVIQGASRRVARELTGGGIPLNMNYAAGQAQTAYDNAAAAVALLPAPAMGLPPRAPPPASDAEIVGLLSLVLYTTYCAARPARVDDMKYAFPMMPRTDFRSMVLGMEADAQAFLLELWNGGAGPLRAELEACLVAANLVAAPAPAAQQMDDPMFPSGYGADAGDDVGPTRADWMSSMVDDAGRNAAAHKDELSPAPGYAQLEGFGQYGADNLDPKLNLLEFRGLATVGAGATITSARWLEVAQAFYHMVDYVENPPVAGPPPGAAGPPPGPPPGGPGPGGPPPGGPAPGIMGALGGLPLPGAGGGAVGPPPTKRRRVGL